MTKLTHLDDNGRANMVDVSDKTPTKRTANAESIVYMNIDTLDLVMEDKISKGSVFETARIAGIMGAKKTSELIPLCHPIKISKISIEFSPDKENSLIKISCTAIATDQTGVEMEALTGALTSALTIYDMCKAYDKGMVIGNTMLISKTGGKSKDYFRADNDRA